jgi:hypothetical protein
MQKTISKEIKNSYGKTAEKERYNTCVGSTLKTVKPKWVLEFQKEIVKNVYHSTAQELASLFLTF